MGLDYYYYYCCCYLLLPLLCLLTIIYLKEAMFVGYYNNNNNYKTVGQNIERLQSKSVITSRKGLNILCRYKRVLL